MNKCKIVILCDSENRYLYNMCISLMKGFHKNGTTCQLLDASKSVPQLNNEIDQLSPDAIFEINRSRGQCPLQIPNSCIHICWLQDAWFVNSDTGQKQLHRSDPRFGKSNIIYSLLDPSYFGIKMEKNDWKILHPGADTDLFFPDLNTNSTKNLATICGYIPKPIKPTGEMRQQVIAQYNNKKATIADLIFNLANINKVSISTHTVNDIHNIITNEINRILGTCITVNDMLSCFDSHWTLLLLDTELPRIPDRLKAANGALQAGLSLELYGPNQWLAWPSISRHYRKNLSWANDLSEVYQKSQFNIHNGAFGMHQRVLECMSSGGTILVNKTEFDQKNDVQSYFKEGEHYISYHPDSITDTLAEWSGRHSMMKEIGLNSSKHVATFHSWEVRAGTILNDIEDLKISVAMQT